MKRRFICAIVLSVLVLMMALCVMADEVDGGSANDLKLKACEVFPEYADVIMSEPDSTNSIQSRIQSADAVEVVRSVSRAASDDCMMTYTEYSDGTALITSQTTAPDKTMTNTDFVNGSDYAQYTVTLEATYTSSDQKFIVTGLKFTYYYDDYDVINSLGSYSGSTTAETTMIGKQLRETATTKAYVTYRFGFRIGQTNNYKEAEATLQVGGNVRTYTCEFRD